MYEQKGLDDILFLMLYGGAAMLAFILVVYMCYTSNEGALATEYLAQVNTLIIIGFVLWRVETLQQLDAENTEEMVTDSESLEGKEDTAAFSIPANIGTQLEEHCKNNQLYLQHDLTLKQLSTIIGTNRTYLSAYFAQQCGFRSYSTFSAAFKRYTGTTVTAWMRQEYLR